MRRFVAPLLGSLAALALPASAAAVPGATSETITVPTSMPGVELNAQVQRPKGDAKVPIILTFTPYGSLAEPDPSDDSLADEYVPKGYARVVADTPGTRGSTGCWDYGGPVEQQAGRELVTALSKLPWSNGKVALIGVSYEGTTANMLAADGAVPGLAAIVPIAAISRWYGYAYQSGVRYAGNTDRPTDEGFDTPLGFDFGFGRTPPPDPSRPQAPQALFDRTRVCDSLEHSREGYSRDPDYIDFWRKRDYLARAAAFRVPVLLAHGWQDYNVKQSEGTDLYEAIPVDDPRTPAAEGVPFKRLYMFQGAHSAPRGSEWAPLLSRFLAKTLKGEDNGVDSDAPVLSFAREDKTADLKARVESAWPPATTGEVVLSLGRAGGAGRLAADTVAGTDTLSDASMTTEETARRRFTDEASWLSYATEPLGADTRLAGTPRVEAVARITGSRAQLDAVLVDLAPDGSSSVISRGFSDVRYRNGLEGRVAIPQDADVRAPIRLAPQDQIVRKGHRIGLILSGSNTAWAVPDDPGARFAVRLGPGGSTLRLPVVGAASIVVPLPDGKGGDAGAPASGGGSTPEGGGAVGAAGDRATSAAARPSIAPIAKGAPAKAAPRVTARISFVRGGRVAVVGSAPRRSRVTVVLGQGKRIVGRRTVTATAKGRYRATFRAPSVGTYRATVRARASARRLTTSARPSRRR